MRSGRHRAAVATGRGRMPGSPGRGQSPAVRDTWPSETRLRTHRTPPVNASVGNHMHGRHPDHAQTTTGLATIDAIPIQQ